MSISRILPILILSLFATLGSLSAQKVGYMNADALMSQMQEVKDADKQLQAYREKKEAAIKTKYKQMNEFLAEAMKAEQEGTLSPVQLEQKQSELEKMRLELRQMQAKAEQDFIKEQSRLIQPIMNKVNEAIERVGKNNDYDYIFNTASGVLLHVDMGEDITDLVKQELGL